MTQHDIIRKRHTFLFPENNNDIETAIQFKDQSVIINKDINVPRQDRVTIPREAFDNELRQIFNFSRIHITWSRYEPFFRDVPFTTVVEPGWHIMLDRTASFDNEKIHSLLNIQPIISNQTVRTPNWNGFYIVGDLSLLSDKFASLVGSPSYLDSIDSLSLTYGFNAHFPSDFQQIHDLVVETYASKAKKDVLVKNPDEKVEIGLFTVSNAYSDFEDHDWALAGVIRNMDDNKFDKTLIHVWPRHRKAEGSFSAVFDEPAGLHPHHRLILNHLKQPHEHCRLYAEYTVPKSLFLDEYQLADLDRRTDSSISTGKLIGVWGETDLEAPVWAVDGWGSESLVQIYFDSNSNSFEFELPMHSRYEIPLNGSTQQNLTMPWPAVFWACHDAENRPHPDFKALGYESFFPENTAFYHVCPTETAEELSTGFHIPVAPLEKYNTIQHVTSLVLLMGFSWVLYRIFAKIKHKKTEKLAQKVVRKRSVRNLRQKTTRTKNE